MKKFFSLLLAFVLITAGVTFAADYTIQEGDTLSEIAVEHKVELGVLVESNDIENPDLIYAGDVLKIPDGAESKPSAPIKNKKTEEPYTGKMTLLHTNDMHGFFLEGKYDGMGAAKIASFIKQKKAENPNTLVLDAGDALQGANIVTVSKGLTGVEIMNSMGYDAMVVGKHEFDYGSKQLKTLMNKTDFPVISANLYTEEGKRFCAPRVIYKKDGVTFGIFGLTTPETYYKSHPDNTKGIKIESIYETSKQQVKELKEFGADVIIALAHLGEEGDYSSVSLAEQVEGIDVIIDGHSHFEYPEGKPVGDTMIVSAGEKTKNVGVVDLEFKDGKLVDVKASLFNKEMAAEITPDEDVQKIVEKVVEQNQEKLGKVIGHSPFVLDGEKEQVRTGETNLGNLITEALLDISKADVAFTNGGGIRASIQKGDITINDVLTVLPFGNTVRVIELKGSELVAALENGFSKYPEALGGFPHVAGLTVTFDPSKPERERVKDVKIGGKDLVPDKTYTLVTNDFLVAGGDAYNMFVGKKVVAEFGAMDEVLIDYINAHGFDKAKVDGRIKPLK